MAGIVSMAELGDEPQNAPIRRPMSYPARSSGPSCKRWRKGNLAHESVPFEQALLKEKEAGGARELIFEIARRSGADAAGL